MCHVLCVHVNFYSFVTILSCRVGYVLCCIHFILLLIWLHFFLFFSFMLIKNVTCFSRYLCCRVRVGVACSIYTPYNLFLLVLYRLFCHFGLIPRLDFFRRCKVSSYKRSSPISSLNDATLLVSMPVYLNVVLISVWLSRYCRVYKMS